MKILPITKLGKLASLCMASFAVLFLFVSVVVVGILGQQGGQTFADNLYISVPMLSALVLAIAALVLGIISVTFRKERALMVFVIIGLGLLIATFVIGELVVPH